MVRCGALLCCLAACSGGSDRPAAPSGDPADAFGAMHARVTGQNISDFMDTPATGTAEYRGLVRLDLPFAGAAATAHYGDLGLHVAFGAAADSVTGSISNLQGAGGGLAGDLQIGNGVLYLGADPAIDYQFSAGLTGTLSQGGQFYDLTGQIAGDFYGPDASGIAGVVYQGAIRQGDGIDLFDGAFVAERSTLGG
ncbi:MAG: hypothetical protein IKD58_05740 [Loktanella sp.]|nr:hypothetical protein [Loktanella sp.]